MRKRVLEQIAAILDKVPENTGLTVDEMRLEVAAQIVENFPRGLQPDVDIDLAKAAELIHEAGVYLEGTLHREGVVIAVPEVVQKQYAFDMYVQTVDERGSALVGSVTRFADMLVDARKIWESEKKPVFLRIECGDEEQLFPLIGEDGRSKVDETNKIVIDVSEQFEPGAESIGDFVLRAAAELQKIGQICNTPEHDGDLGGAVAASGSALISVEGDY